MNIAPSISLKSLLKWSSLLRMFNH